MNEHLNNEQWEDVGLSVNLCAQSLAVFGKTFFPDRFKRKFDPIHRDMLSVIDARPGDPGYKRMKAVAAPRGIGKTSLANFGKPAQSTLFCQKHFIVPISASTTLALQQSENLKRGLTQNPIVTKLFGDVKTEKFSQDMWITQIGDWRTCIMPRGADSQVRGLLFEDWRPDLIIIDDYETAETAGSVEQRLKRKKQLLADVLNTVDRGSDDWEILVIGTVLHQASLLMDLLEDPNWMSVRLELCDDEFRSNAPSFQTDEQCKALYQQYVDQGEPHVFYQEYRNNPVGTGEDAIFQPQMFKHYDESKANLAHNPDIENVIILDPARNVKMNSAESGIVGVGIDVNKRRFYVRYALAERWHPDEFYAEVAKAIRAIDAKIVAVEVTGLYEFVTYPLMNYLTSHNIHVELIELHARGGVLEKGKIERVRSLVSEYRMGRIYHNAAMCQKLEGQLLGFPFSRRWDLMDPLGYISEVFELGKRFFKRYDATNRNVLLTEEQMFNRLRKLEPLEDPDWNGEGIEASLAW